MIKVLDSDFLRALTEPARLEILRVLMLHGPADVGTISNHVPQDRSVVSRHLQSLERAGVLQVAREGRHTIYAIDGAGFIRTLEGILGEAKSLVAQCCPPLAQKR
jgi:DNA-binding transcriptional ArsR family regulator